MAEILGQYCQALLPTAFGTAQWAEFFKRERETQGEASEVPLKKRPAEMGRSSVVKHLPSLLRPWVASPPHFCHIPYPQIRKSTSGRSQNMRTSSPCEAFPARRWAFLQRQGRGTCSSGEVMLKLPACCLLHLMGAGRQLPAMETQTMPGL